MQELAFNVVRVDKSYALSSDVALYTVKAFCGGKILFANVFFSPADANHIRQFILKYDSVIGLVNDTALVDRLNKGNV